MRGGAKFPLTDLPGPESGNELEATLPEERGCCPDLEIGDCHKLSGLPLSADLQLLG